MRNIFTKALGVLLGVFLFGTSFASDVFVSLDDGISGETVSVRVSGLMMNEDIGMRLLRTDKSAIVFSEKADEQGVLNLKIFGLHLKKAGEYKLEISRIFNPSNPIIKSFNVFPGVVSAYRSEIKMDKESIAADGEAQGRFVITLKDAYGNVVPKQKVQVFSSRNEDLVIYDKISDEYGIVKGYVQSKTPGISTLSVVTNETIVYQKQEIVFYLSDKNALKNVGAGDNLGQFLKAQLFDDVGFQEVERFTIEDLPSEVSMDKRYTFRVVAKDVDGEVVPNYLGKVRFASGDDQATLPADYEFDEMDQGSHTFALAVIFGSAGEHTLTVSDLNDFRIAGEATVTVVDSSKTTISDGEPGIKILTPTPGTFRSSRITITGKVIGADYVKIEDGPTELIGELEVDASGEFVYQTPALADGTHKFRVSSVDGSLISEEITITVDQSAPTVMLVELDPRKVMTPNESFAIKVSSNEILSSAKCILDEIQTELELSGDRFVGTFQAPNACGVYPISCSVSDLLGNELEEPNAEIVNVCGDDPNVGGEGNVKSKQNKPTPTGISPTAVSNLSAVSGENRITLFWSPAKDDMDVEKYRILFGLNRKDLNEFNITPDNRTQWYVDNLDIGRNYYFQVFAVDSEGKTGIGSNIVQATTKGDSIHNSAPRRAPTSGGNHWLPAIFALLIGGLFTIKMRKKV